MPAELLSNLRAELKKNSDEKTRISGKRFFKEEIKLYGVKSATVAKISKKYFDLLPINEKKEIFALCEDLLKTDYMEESFVAFDWSERMHKKYEPADYKTFERWVEKYVNNWAKCDTLCNHTIGSFVEMYPEYVNELKCWARSDNRWVKRAAAVTLILPARKGLFLEDIFEIADILLVDEDDMVQKGYGWMLKEASKKHLKEVHSYVLKNKKNMPRTALRYAIEKMPEDMRKEAMAN